MRINEILGVDEKLQIVQLIFQNTLAQLRGASNAVSAPQAPTKPVGTPAKPVIPKKRLGFKKPPRMPAPRRAPSPKTVKPAKRAAPAPKGKVTVGSTTAAKRPTEIWGTVNTQAQEPPSIAATKPTGLSSASGLRF